MAVIVKNDTGRTGSQRKMGIPLEDMVIYVAQAVR